jgi:predicted AlkP superfamily pyrophosphatase or phosphodiesterase
VDLGDVICGGHWPAEGPVWNTENFMDRTVVLLSIPGLREADLRSMPHLASGLGFSTPLTPSFPAVTWPVQTNMLTGCLPRTHGVIGNGFYWRESRQVEMWTAWNERILAPQIWDVLAAQRPGSRSAAWFPMLSKGCGADYVCMPAPVHHPDGSESLWCYTQPSDYYGVLRDALGHFPLQHFWGPLAGIASTAWIVDSAVLAAAEHRPDFFYIYLPHLDYAAQKDGPDSPRASQAVEELDGVLERLFAGFAAAYGGREVTWLAASEYVIQPVSHVSYPNRVLREAGWLQVREEQGGEMLDLEGSAAWALVDHQFSHVFVRDDDAGLRTAIAQRLAAEPGIAEVLVGDELAKYGLDHPRAGDIVAISESNSWQAYYWWWDDGRAPAFARTVDIHRKPGYDPVELFFDPATRGIPLDASLVRGSHGAPVTDSCQRGVFLSSQSDVLPNRSLRDVDVAGLVLGLFGIGGL